MKKSATKRILSVFLCVCVCFSMFSVSSLAARDTSYEEMLAQDLKELGLFKGVSETNFGLNRAPTRVEALVMLIRVLGKESEALGGSWSHPFTDVPKWANNYVGYAYEKGLTNGVSAKRFGTGDANAQMYLTFVLRALGYSDTDGLDFTYSNPFTLAKSVGILPDCVNTVDFWRADVVLVSYAALVVNLKDSSRTLAQKLISDGVFTDDAFESVYDFNAIKNYPKEVELDAEQIYAKCAPAVFYIEVADKNGMPFASGSGFFISSDGTAVTNYHVIEDAYSAKITLSTTNKQYNVAGVYDYDEDEDWAILKIDGSGFPYLDIADMSTVVGGAKCYAIGSPKGLQNTISEGIISNPAQTVEGTTYIQISAAISHGSSGGALINKFGKVIGITSAIYEGGENLGFAIPVSKISGYSRSQCTALATLFPNSVSPASSAAQDAYACLAAFVQTYYNLETSTFIAYEEMQSTSTGYIDLRVIYEFKNDFVAVQRSELYSGLEYHTIVVFDPDSYDQLVTYSMYDSNYSDSPVFDAYSWVYAPGFYGDNLSFDNISVNKGYDVATNEAIASQDLQQILAATDYIFYNYLSDYGDFDVSLFGFENYYLYG